MEKGGSNDDMTVFRTREDMCRVQLYHSLWPVTLVPFVHSASTLSFAQYLEGLDLHWYKNVSTLDVDITYCAHLRFSAIRKSYPLIKRKCFSSRISETYYLVNSLHT